MTASELLLSRVARYLEGVSFAGVLARAKVERVKPHGARWAELSIVWPVPDTDGSDSEWQARVVVRLREGGDEASWDRALLEGLADQLGHELGEAVQREGRPLADPHQRPRVWPWRATDRESS
jgi:hypothetical protein